MTKSQDVSASTSLQQQAFFFQGTGFHLVVIQRPPGPYSQSLEEICELIANLVTVLLRLKHRDPVIVPVTQMFLCRTDTH